MKQAIAHPIGPIWRRTLTGVAGLPLAFSVFAAATISGATFATEPVVSAQANLTDSVDIQNFAFSPSSLTVEPGTIVTWTNQDDAPHTVTSDDATGGPRSTQLQNGQMYSYTFDQPGTYRYHCQIHPDMRGAVIVTGGNDTNDNDDALIAVQTQNNNSNGSVVRAESSQATQTVSQTLQLNVRTTQTQQVRSNVAISSNSGQSQISAQTTPPAPIVVTPLIASITTDTSAPPVTTTNAPAEQETVTTTPSTPEGGRGGGDVTVAAAETPPADNVAAAPPVGGMGAGGFGADTVASGPVEAGQRATDTGLPWPVATFGSILLLLSIGLMTLHRWLAGRR